MRFLMCLRNHIPNRQTPKQDQSNATRLTDNVSITCYRVTLPSSSLDEWISAFHSLCFMQNSSNSNLQSARNLLLSKSIPPILVYKKHQLVSRVSLVPMECFCKCSDIDDKPARRDAQQQHKRQILKQSRDYL